MGNQIEAILLMSSWQLSNLNMLCPAILHVINVSDLVILSLESTNHTSGQFHNSEAMFSQVDKGIMSTPYLKFF
jgi:hypothetical protein